ncbi:hypothetical protein WMY93_000966 [Mugilogobius chulae]|uniref:Chemokine interleukin-8-like domain-containing protein n=1 Tax=Mugilogobius chulae TaxID=88201 RepID=A0AAW0Q2G6_9GOBI
MKWITVLALLVVCCVCFSVTQGSFDDCCLKYVKKPSRSIRVIQKHAVAYRRQEADGSCNIQATVFILKRGRIYCTDPYDKWVQDLVSKIDKGRARSKSGRRPHKG